MKTKEIIQLNANLQTQLTSVNEEYYGDLLVYVRTLAFLRDEQQTEELLLSILQDILDAQKNGRTAEAYFGKKPKEFADEIIQQLPFNVVDTAKLVAYGIGAYFLFSILPTLINPTRPFDVGTFSLTSIYVGAFSIFALWVFGKSTYHVRRSFKLLAAVFIGFLFAGGIAVNIFVSTPLKIYFGGFLGSATILIVALISGYLLAKQDNKKIWLPLIPVLTTSAFLGIFSRLPISSHYFDFSTQQGKTILAVTLCIALFLQFVLLFWLGYSSKQKK
ncbi:hypothetical protein EsVE80_24620 [Enterococcus saigonensis]|uniref:Uncharacterized protein n=1 Tax=Enterococcus saigonensis TaxID=1805431 RepID=A0A679IEX7_9ENTE|nr:hypothetical protein [Enterococcus saigonensis]BCA86939.1 hypothetical protein EsVE80_24620 [Enterococcus saigonensis]